MTYPPSSGHTGQSKHASATNSDAPCHPPIWGYRQSGSIHTLFLIGALFLSLFWMGCPTLKKAEDPKANGKAGAPGPGGDNAPVPVLAAQSVQRDITIHLPAVGHVEPVATVSIKAQVGAQLSEVHFTKGQEVKKGDLLFTLDARPYKAALAQEEANLARDEIEERKAQQDNTRYTDLNNRQVVSKDEFERIRTVALSKAAQLQADRAAVEAARLQVSFCTIYSPISGVAGDLETHVGNIIKANDTALVEINQIQPIEVAFSIPETDLPLIRQAQLAGPVPIYASFPGGKESDTTTGTLTFIDNTVDSQGGTIRLKATFENQDRRLWPGLFVNVVISAGVQKNAVAIPAQALQTGQSGPCVFIIKPDNTIESVPVTPGRRFDGWIVIEKGLDANVQVVTDGHLRLRKDSKVEVRKSLDSGVEQN
jgi:multidrug efflux system membrane fusion protein